jgi:4-hydroxy-2-oxoheptanedioate aldolase
MSVVWWGLIETCLTPKETAYGPGSAVQRALKETAERIRAAGKSAGTLATDPDDVERLFGLGFNFIAVGSDVSILARAAERLAARFRQKETSQALHSKGAES